MPGPGSGPAAAAGTCAQRASVVDRLEKTYGETRRGIGLAGDAKGVIEVFASDETGTWTITMTLPSGLACLLASGQNWAPAPLPREPEGDPA
ncbi:hypothetical protein V8J39_14435 [Frigidibacter sp. MR17.24]